MMAWWNPFSSDACEPGGIIDAATVWDPRMFIGVVRDLLEGGSVISIPDSACMAPGDVRKIMKRNDIESWGYAYSPGSDGFMFSVHDYDKQRAVEALRRGA